MGGSILPVPHIRVTANSQIPSSRGSRIFFYCSAIKGGRVKAVPLKKKKKILKPFFPTAKFRGGLNGTAIKRI